MLRRLANDCRGQALGEYGLVLALAAGIGWIQRTAERLADDPRLLWGAGIVLVLGFLVLGRRR